LAAGTAVSQTLETARSQVEQRFLEGGTVLLSVMDVLNRLLNSLDSITKALDNEGSRAMPTPICAPRSTA